MGTTESKLLYTVGLFGGGLLLLILNDDSGSNSVSGISNLGNTCFLNSILQALSSCDTFTNFLGKLMPVPISDEDFDGEIVIELSNFLQNLMQGRQISPEDLIFSLSHKFPYFGQQQDSHEIFYVIHESIENIKKRTENSISLEKNLVNPLLGLMSTEIICSVCRNKTIKLDSVFDISLSVSNSLDISLANLYRPQVLEDFLCLKCSSLESISLVSKNKNNFFAKEIMKKHSSTIFEEKDLIRKIKTRAAICNKIVKFPELLCIHCKWLVPHSSGMIQKKKENMHFPMKLHTPKGLYALKAVIEHQGGSTGGHYLTYKFHCEKWFQCSDLAIREVTETEVLTAQPYMLFYQFIN